MATRQISAKKPKDLGYTVRKFLAYLASERALLTLVVLGIAISVGGNIVGTYMIKPVVNGIMETHDNSVLAKGVLATAAIFAFGVIGSVIYTQGMARASNRIVYNIRRDLFTHMESLPLSFFDTHRHGDVMSLYTNDTDTISDALSNSFAPIIKNALQIVGTFLVMVILNWQLTLVTLVFYIVMFLYLRFSGKRSKAYYTVQQKKIGDLNGFIEEMISGVKVVKVFNHEEENLASFRQKNEELRKAGTGAQTYAATMIPCVVSLGFLNYALVAILGGLMVIEGWTDIGSLASYLVFVRQSSAPINQFTQQSNFLLASLAGAERIFHTLEEKSEEDGGDVRLEKEDDGKCDWVLSDGTRIPLKGDVRLFDVDFSYDKKVPVLDKVSLYARPGEKIAFVGSTGAGKTTITNLLGSFYEIDSGRILYDGLDIRNIKKSSLRASFSMVLQDTHLFTGTIEENIRYGNLDATAEEVVEAAKIANADSFIRRLPEGYATMVRNDGSNLSAGQRQLLSIARAAVGNPPVLILDEATSNVDTRTEDQIEKAMDRLMEGRTVLVIAHRLSTVRNSQAIMVLEHGRIIERGSHEDLLAMKGTYYKLYNGLFELS